MKWTPEQDDALLDAYLCGATTARVPATATLARAMALVRPADACTAKTMDRRLWALGSHTRNGGSGYEDGGPLEVYRPTPRRMCRYDEPWNAADRQMLRWALTAGQTRSPPMRPAHLARVLGRRVREVRERWTLDPVGRKQGFFQ